MAYVTLKKGSCKKANRFFILEIAKLCEVLRPLHRLIYGGGRRAPTEVSHPVIQAHKSRNFAARHVFPVNMRLCRVPVS